MWSLWACFLRRVVFAYLEFSLWSMSEFTTVFVGVSQHTLLCLLRSENHKSKMGCFLKIPTKRKGKLSKKKPLALISSFLSCLWETYVACICFLHFLIRELWWACDRETSYYVTFSFLGLNCDPFSFCRHMGPLKSMRYGSLLKAIYNFSMVRQNYGKCIFVLFCNCYFFQITWMRTNDRTKSLEILC